jgi:hypothetical protein
LDLKPLLDIARRLAAAVFGEHSEWFWVMMQTIVILVSLIFIYRQVRLQRYSNLLQMLIKMRETWDSPQMIRHRQTTCQNHRTGSKKIDAAEGQVLGFFEEMGLLLRKGVLEEEFVWGTHSYFIEHYWSMLQNNIKEYRLATEDSSWFEELETLRKRMGKFAKKKKVSGLDKTEAEIAAFILGEMSL